MKYPVYESVFLQNNWISSKFVEINKLIYWIKFKVERIYQWTNFNLNLGNKVIKMKNIKFMRITHFIDKTMNKILEFDFLSAFWFQLYIYILWKYKQTVQGLVLTFLQVLNVN